MYTAIQRSLPTLSVGMQLIHRQVLNLNAMRVGTLLPFLCCRGI